MIGLSRSRRPHWASRPALLGLTGAGLFLAALDAYVVVAALLPMLTSVNVPVNHLERATPIITGFLLGYLAIMPLSGGLSDRFGRVRVFGACLLIFAAGSLLTATATSLSQMVAGRVLQGAGGGALVPVVLALAADLHEGADRAPILGGVSAVQEVGSVLGPIWGGVVAATVFGWRAIFWINVLAAALLGWALWPALRTPPQAHRRAPIDWPGVVLAGAGLTFLTLGLYAADPAHSALGAGAWWQLPLAALLLVLFALQERRASHPLLEVRHFRDSGFLGAALTNAIAGAGLITALVFIPVLAESPIFGLSSRQAGFLLFRLLLGIPVGALLGGILARRLQSHRAVAALGMALAAASFFWLAQWDQDALHRHLLGGPVLLADLQLFSAGLGLGLEIAPVSAAILDVMGEQERGAGASFLVIMRLLGMLVGFSLLAGYGLYHFNQAVAHIPPPPLTLGVGGALGQAEFILRFRQAILDEYHTIFAAAAVLVMAGAVVAAAFLRPPLKRPV